MRQNVLPAAIYAALIVTLLAVPKASADNCGRVQVAANSYGYGYKAVADHSYVANHHDVVVKPYAIPLAYFPNSFYSVEPNLAQLRLQKEIAEDAATKAADRAVEKFLNAIIAARGASDGGSHGPSPSPSFGGTASLVSKVQTLANARCVSCHGSPGANGIDLTDVSKLNEGQRMSFERRVKKKPGDKLAMPKGKQPLAEEEKDLVAAWVDEAPKIPPAK